jgi:hypothetical protein
LVAFSVNLAAAVIAIGFASATFLYLRKQNRKLEAGEPMEDGLFDRLRTNANIAEIPFVLVR